MSHFCISILEDHDDSQLRRLEDPDYQLWSMEDAVLETCHRRVNGKAPFEVMVVEIIPLFIKVIYIYIAIPGGSPEF